MNKKYYIYHITGVKIGCTINPKHRIQKAQKYNNYEILEIHTDENIAADREIELQKQYGYQVDKRKYNSNFTSNQLSKGGINSAKNKSKEEFFGGKKAKGTRDNMLKAAKIGRKVFQEKYGTKIEAYDYETKKFIKVFISIRQMCKELNCSYPSVRNVLCGKQLKHKTFFFKII